MMIDRYLGSNNSHVWWNWGWLNVFNLPISHSRHDLTLITRNWRNAFATIFRNNMINIARIMTRTHTHAWMHAYTHDMCVPVDGIVQEWPMSIGPASSMQLGWLVVPQFRRLVVVAFVAYHPVFVCLFLYLDVCFLVCWAVSVLLFVSVSVPFCWVLDRYSFYETKSKLQDPQWQQLKVVVDPVICVAPGIPQWLCLVGKLPNNQSTFPGWSASKPIAVSGAFLQTKLVGW